MRWRLHCVKAEPGEVECPWFPLELEPGGHVWRRIPTSPETGSRDVNCTGRSSTLYRTRFPGQVGGLIRPPSEWSPTDLVSGSAAGRMVLFIG